MILTIDEKISIIQEKINEAERSIRCFRNPSDEEIEAQTLTGIREKVVEQVARQTQAIYLFNEIIDDLKRGIDQIG